MTTFHMCEFPFYEDRDLPPDKFIPKIISEGTIGHFCHLTNYCIFYKT